MVELLEQGRGVFWSQLTRLHFPLDNGIVSSSAGRMLADDFTWLSLLIRNALNSSGADQHERLCHLKYEMQRVVADIRKLPGLSRFLFPLLFSDLQCAASGGPVIVVNASEYDCDALIVFLIGVPFIFSCRSHRKMSVTCQRSSIPWLSPQRGST